MVYEKNRQVVSGVGKPEVQRVCRELALWHYIQDNKVSDRLPLLAGDGQRGGGESVFGFVLVIFLGKMKVTRVGGSYGVKPVHHAFPSEKRWSF